MTRRRLDPEFFHVNVETLASSGDPAPFDAAPWLVTLRDGEDILADAGLTQIMRPGADPRPATVSQFGADASNAVFSVVTGTRVGSGDLIVAQVQIYAPQPDEDVLTAYGLLRAMCVLRAAAIHFPFGVVDESVLGRLASTHWDGGATAHIVDAITEHDHLLDMLFSPHRGLHLVRPA